MASYLDSPMYQRMMAETLRGSQRGPQYPGEAVANALATALQAYSTRQYGKELEGRDAAKSDALAQALGPADNSAWKTGTGMDASGMPSPVSVSPRVGAGIGERIAATGNRDLINETGPAMVQALMGQQARANEPIRPIEQAQLDRQSEQDAIAQDRYTEGRADRWSERLGDKEARAAELQDNRAGRFSERLGDREWREADRKSQQLFQHNENEANRNLRGQPGARTLTERDRNILNNGDPSSAEYASVYADVGSSRVVLDPTTGTMTTIRPDMSPYRAPTYRAPGVGAASPSPSDKPVGTPTVTATQNTDPRAIKIARAQIGTMAKTMPELVANVKKMVGGLSAKDKAAAIAGVNTPAMGGARAAFNLMLSALRDPAILNTGVLQPAELGWINTFMTDPGTIKGIIQGDETMFAQLDQIQSFLDAKGKGLNVSMPEGVGGQGGASAGGEQTATGPNGQKLILRNGQWVPMQ